MKLLIISHTEHYRQADGTILGWGPTVTEINHLAKDFEEIYHLAFLHPDAPPPSSIPYTNGNIHFIPIKPVGGKGLGAKFHIIYNIPTIIGKVREILPYVDVFQLRTPTGIGVFLIPYLTFFSKKKGWYKYAGNWNQKNAPLGYSLQRWMLERQFSRKSTGKRKITINGSWPGQRQHCITFENPCLTEAERAEGLQITNEKQFNAPFSFCFVGRLEDAKGVQRILGAFGKLGSLAKVNSIHFIGSGMKLETYKRQAEALNLPAHFHGFLKREDVFEVYKSCEFFLLPSTASEGFPKVIAESMNFGCVPIVSNISSIGQYVNADNGFIINPCTSEELGSILKIILDLEKDVLRKKALTAHHSVFQFTFEKYRERILQEIIV